MISSSSTHLSTPSLYVPPSVSQTQTPTQTPIHHINQTSIKNDMKIDLFLIKIGFNYLIKYFKNKYYWHEFCILTTSQIIGMGIWKYYALEIEKHIKNLNEFIIKSLDNETIGNYFVFKRNKPIPTISTDIPPFKISPTQYILMFLKLNHLIPILIVNNIYSIESLSNIKVENYCNIPGLDKNQLYLIKNEINELILFLLKEIDIKKIELLNP